MFINVSSVWRSSQLITDTVRAAQWGQFDEGSWLDGETQPERRRVCLHSCLVLQAPLFAGCTCPACVEYWNLPRHLLTFKSRRQKARTLMKCHLNILSTPACVSWHLGQIWKATTFQSKGLWPVPGLLSLWECGVLWTGSETRRRTKTTKTNKLANKQTETPGMNESGVLQVYLQCAYSTTVAWKQP